MQKSSLSSTPNALVTHFFDTPHLIFSTKTLALLCVCCFKFWELALRGDTPSTWCNNGRYHTKPWNSIGWQGLGHLARLSLPPTQLKISFYRRLNASPFLLENMNSLSSFLTLSVSLIHTHPLVKRDLEILYNSRLSFKWNRTDLYSIFWSGSLKEPFNPVKTSAGRLLLLANEWFS